MKVLLWEMEEIFAEIVLYDGKYLYWSDEMRASGGYENLKFGKINKLTGSRFTYIGELDQFAPTIRGFTFEAGILIEKAHRAIYGDD